jgi:hypothetical protein
MMAARAPKPGAICRFEFLISEPSGSRWVQIQGSGGQLGNQLLYLGTLLQGPKLAGLKAHLLQQARNMLQRDGSLRLWINERPWFERVETCQPNAVIACREVRSKA